MSADDEQVRYCPGCGLIGPVKRPALACCPDSCAMSMRRWQAEKIERELDRLRGIIGSLRAATPAQPTEAPDMRAICEALGFDPTNHHNAAKCPYCRPAQPTEVERDAARYRFLRQHVCKPQASITLGIWGVDGNSHAGHDARNPEAVDAAIDAALSTEGGGNG